MANLKDEVDRINAAINLINKGLGKKKNHFSRHYFSIHFFSVRYFK